MAEIKSTLELIMERTKDLTMTEAEKEQFEKSEAEGRIRGILQKYMDDYIKLERVEKEIALLGQGQEALVKNILIKECINRIELENENVAIQKILQDIVNLDTVSMTKAILECRELIDKEKVTRKAGLMEGLRVNGISGSAVDPNLNGDDEWLKFLKKEKTKLKKYFHSLYLK